MIINTAGAYRHPPRDTVAIVRNVQAAIRVAKVPTELLRLSMLAPTTAPTYADFFACRAHYIATVTGQETRHSPTVQSSMHTSTGLL